MSDDELRVLANKRVKSTGRFTKSALRAQTELYKRKRWETSDKHVCDMDEKDICELQYQGYL